MTFLHQVEEEGEEGEGGEVPCLVGVEVQTTEKWVDQSQVGEEEGGSRVVSYQVEEVGLEVQEEEEVPWDREEASSLVAEEEGDRDDPFRRVVLGVDKASAQTVVAEAREEVVASLGVGVACQEEVACFADLRALEAAVEVAYQEGAEACWSPLGSGAAMVAEAAYQDEEAHHTAHHHTPCLRSDQEDRSLRWYWVEGVEGAVDQVEEEGVELVAA